MRTILLQKCYTDCAGILSHLIAVKTSGAIPHSPFVRFSGVMPCLHLASTLVRFNIHKEICFWKFVSYTLHVMKTFDGV